MGVFSLAGGRTHKQKPRKTLWTPEQNQEASEEASQLGVPGRRHSMWEDMKVRERQSIAG